MADERPAYAWAILRDLGYVGVSPEELRNRAGQESQRSREAAPVPLNPLLLVSWYEFIDFCSNCGGWPLVENHWGILTYADGVWGVKLAYDNLRYEVSRWN